MGNLVNSQEENINIILVFKATELHIIGLSNDITDLLGNTLVWQSDCPV